MGRKLLNSELGRPSLEEFGAVERIPVVVVLDNVRSSFNVGAAFRSCDAFAVRKIYLCGICSTPPDAEIHKSALGAEFSISWEYFDETVAAVQSLKREGYKIIAIEQTVDSIKLPDLNLPLQIGNKEQYALIFGNEVNGIAQEVVDLCDAVIEIPQYGTKHSINVSVSVGIILWEFLRRLK